MANNRIAIVCKDCNVGIAIAKYYPLVKKIDHRPGIMTIGGVDSPDNMGWYTENNKKLFNQLDQFFLRHKHDYDFSNFGGSQYYLGYESDDKIWKYEEENKTHT